MQNLCARSINLCTNFQIFSIQIPENFFSKMLKAWIANNFLNFRNWSDRFQSYFYTDLFMLNLKCCCCSGNSHNTIISFCNLQERYALKLLKPFFKIHVCLPKVLQQNSESANTRLDTTLLASFLHCLTMYVLVLAQKARKKSTVYILTHEYCNLIKFRQNRIKNKKFLFLGHFL